MHKNTTTMTQENPSYISSPWYSSYYSYPWKIHYKPSFKSQFPLLPDRVSHAVLRLGSLFLHIQERWHNRRCQKVIQEVPSLQVNFKCLLYIFAFNSLQCIRKIGMLICFLHQVLQHPLDGPDCNACSHQVTLNQEGRQRKFGSDFTLNNDKTS